MTEPSRHESGPGAGLQPCDREIFGFARRLAVAGAATLLVGLTGLLASSGQGAWDILRSFYLTLAVLGPVGIFIADRLRRILMKHRRTEVSFF